MHRRRFLAAAALSSFAYATHAAEPAKKWRVVIMGSKGGYGHGLDTMWKTVPETEIVAAADKDPKGLEAAKAKMGLTQGFTDYAEMSAAKPDLIAIGTTMGLHHEMTLAAAASGARGIYLEKPFCRTLAEADDILSACEKNGVKLSLAHRNRFHPVLPVVRKLVADGEIGQLLELRGRGKEDKRGGMEDLWILGSHVVNVAVFLGGKPLACSALITQNGRPATPADVIRGRDDYGPLVGNALHARFDLDSGVPFYFDSVQEAGNRDAGFGLQLIGTKGIIDLRMDRTPIAHLIPGSPFQPSGEPRPWIPITTAGAGQPEPVENLGKFVMDHTAAAKDLIASIEENRPPLCDGAEARVTVEMITAVMASHVRNGERVTFPLSITGNPLENWS